MVRRLPHLFALVAVLLLAMPTAALAYTARLEKPANGAVTGTTEVHVRVSREFGDVGIRGLRVRPAGGGELRGTECVSDCGGRHPTFSFSFDPRTGAPFGGGILPNGPYEFEGIISRELGARDTSIGTFRLNLRVPGSAVGGLAATANGTAVRLAWSRAPEPDIVGYRIERCAGTCDGGGNWRAIADALASASAFNDEPGVGKHSYRVVTIRSGGDDGNIETVSSPVGTEIEPPASPPPAPGDGDGTGGTGGDETGGDGNGNGNGSGSGSGGGGSGGDGNGRGDGASRSGGEDRSVGTARTGDAPDLGDGEAPTAEASPRAADARSADRSGGVRSGKAPSVALGRGGSGIPELPAIGDIFRGELDYAAQDPEAASGTSGRDGAATSGDEVILSAPGSSSGSFIGQLSDPNRIAVPIAGGLLMTAIGLHLWRWLRIPLK